MIIMHYVMEYIGCRKETPIETTSV